MWTVKVYGILELNSSSYVSSIFFYAVAISFLVNSMIFISTATGKLPEVLPHFKVSPLTRPGRLRSQRCPAIFLFLQLMQPRRLSWKLFLMCSTRLWITSVLDNSSNLQNHGNQTMEVSEICFLEEIKPDLGSSWSRSVLSSYLYIYFNHRLYIHLGTWKFICHSHIQLTWENKENAASWSSRVSTFLVFWCRL